MLISLASYKAYIGNESHGEVDNSGFFWVAIFASVLTGMGQAMGEATFLGFCNKFPSHVVGYVSSGTGCAGLTATGTLFVLQSIGLPNHIIFLVVAPTLLIYIGCATFLGI